MLPIVVSKMSEGATAEKPPKKSVSKTVVAVVHSQQTGPAIVPVGIHMIGDCPYCHVSFNLNPELNAS